MTTSYIVLVTTWNNHGDVILHRITKTNSMGRLSNSRKMVLQKLLGPELG